MQTQQSTISNQSFIAVGRWLALGLVIGTLIGHFAGNEGLGSGLGIVIGLVIGFAFSYGPNKVKKQSEYTLPLSVKFTVLAIILSIFLGSLAKLVFGQESLLDSIAIGIGVGIAGLLSRRKVSV